MDAPKLPPRPMDGHKGTFGTVLVVGGQAAAPRVMIGGPALAALGALRVGAGLVVLAVPESLVAAAIGIVPSATAIALPIDRAGRIIAAEAAVAIDAVLPSVRSVVIGPGLGAGEAQRQLTVRMLGLDGPPMVVDADALNALAAIGSLQLSLRAPSILTPHPGEWRRLAEALGIRGDATDESKRPAAATALAQRLGAVVVLKGARTVVADGLREWICQHENPALATAGTGDVLAGIIAGAVAQWGGGDNPLDLFDAARLSVLLHAEAAAAWSQRHGTAGLVAEELAAILPDVLHRRREEVGEVGESQPSSP